MSLSSALSNAVSGLNAMSRSAGVVSDNLANAMTDGYGRREVNLSSRWTGGPGGGVQIDGIARIVDRTVIADRRQAEARLEEVGVQTDFLARVSKMMGEPGSGAALGDRMAALDAALIDAATRPEAQPRLSAVLYALKDVAGQLNEVSDGIQTARNAADTQISREVAAVNANLLAIEDLNADIRRNFGSGTDVSGLLDERRRLVDAVTEVIPVREIDRGRGGIALMTAGGDMLLDPSAARLGFTPVNVVTPYLSIEGGTLSGITLNDRPIDMTRSPSSLDGGRLAGLFAVRDELAPSIQADVDAYARDLMERLEGADATRPPGSPGLLTDAGAPLDPADTKGLAGRIAVNAAVDPEAGGDLWKLRTGLGAPDPGDVGQAAGLRAIVGALDAVRAPADGSFAGNPRSISGLAADVISRVGVDLTALERQQTNTRTKAEIYRQTELAGGVDSDQELQRLLMIEQAYSANARVIQTVEDMLATLMRI